MAKRVYFRFPAPDAKEVAVAGSFNNWVTSRPMKRNKDGTWMTWMNLEPGRYEYRYLVDGQWVNDPSSTQRAPNPHGSENDVLVV